MLEEWARAKPDEVKEFAAACHQHHQTLRNSNGMTEDRSMAYSGLIPRTVYIVMHRYIPDFGKRPELIAMVQNKVMPSGTKPKPKKIHFAPKLDYLDD